MLYSPFSLTISANCSPVFTSRWISTLPVSNPFCAGVSDFHPNAAALNPLMGRDFVSLWLSSWKTPLSGITYFQFAYRLVM